MANEETPIRRTTTSFDGVPIAYSTSGWSKTALIFIHGGMSDRSFWDAQHLPFSKQFRVIALDLAGHGESGQGRREWGLPQFGRDVAAVMDSERVARAVLIGNSLGGPAAMEAALLTGPRVLAIIGVDTFQSLTWATTPEQARARAEAFRKDYHGSVDQMLRMLLHADTPPELYEDIRRRISTMPVDAVCAMFESFGGYDPAAVARRLTIPVRSINGDKFPTDVAANRQVIADFDVVTIPHTGHYLMLECPDEFNRRLAGVLRELGIW